jgi:hypothetical protein
MDQDDAEDSEFDYAFSHRRRGRWRRRWRIARWTFGSLLVIALVAALVYHERVVEQYRAFVVLATTVDAPVAAPAVRMVTREPHVSDTTIAGTPVTIARPAGRGPWPTMIFITGADPKGRHEAHVTRLAQGLARAGIVAIVPDLPGLADAKVTADTLEAGSDLVTEASERASTKDDEVSIASVSTGASIALLIAENDQVVEHINSITAIAPFADLRQALLMMTTGKYRRLDGSFTAYKTDPYLKRAIKQSLVENLAGLEPPQLTALLDNTDPERFDELYKALPEPVTNAIDQLSPLANAHKLKHVHVEIATSTHDKYFPADESRALAHALPDARLTVTDALDHAIPELSGDSISDLAALDAFLMRAVRHTMD